MAQADYSAVPQQDLDKKIEKPEVQVIRITWKQHLQTSLRDKKKSKDLLNHAHMCCKESCQRHVLKSDKGLGLRGGGRYR
jgi:hypothetical protein